MWIDYAHNQECNRAHLCDFVIAVSPVTAKVGDVLTITAVTGNFSSKVGRNVVTIAGINVSITTFTTHVLTVTVPNGVGSGDVVVNNLDASCGTSQPAPLLVTYDDIAIPSNYVLNLSTQRFNATTQQRQIFSIGVQQQPFYLKDLSFSNYTQIVDENSVIQDVYAMLLTDPTGRLFRPDIGFGINSQVFNIMNTQDQQNLLANIASYIQQYQPLAVMDLSKSFLNYNQEQNGYEAILALSVPTGSVKYIAISLHSANGTDYYA